MAVPVAHRLGHCRGDLRFRAQRSLVALARQCGVELGFQEAFDEAANARAHPCLQRIEPIFSEEDVPFGRRVRNASGRDMGGDTEMTVATPNLYENKGQRNLRCKAYAAENWQVSFQGSTPQNLLIT